MKSRWLRWTKRIALGCVALLGLGLAALFIKAPTETIFLLEALVYSLFANDKPPPLFKDDLAGMWNKWDEASQRLTSRLQQQFPAGTAETLLKSALLKQGFESLTPPRSDCVPAGQELPVGRVITRCPTHDPSKTLTYHWGGVVCTEIIAVQWTTDDADAIAKVSGTYYAGCL
jgi:hypothetical protein